MPNNRVLIATSFPDDDALRQIRQTLSNRVFRLFLPTLLAGLVVAGLDLHLMGLHLLGCLLQFSDSLD